MLACLNKKSRTIIVEKLIGVYLSDGNDFYFN